MLAITLRPALLLLASFKDERTLPLIEVRSIMSMKGLQYYIWSFFLFLSDLLVVVGWDVATAAGPVTGGASLSLNGD